MRYFFIITVIVLTMFSCDAYVDIPEKKMVNMVTLSKPSFSKQNNLTLKAGTEIVISSKEDVYVIYTIDGTLPSINNNYSASYKKVTHQVVRSATLKAVSYKNGYYSEVVELVFNVN